MLALNTHFLSALSPPLLFALGESATRFNGGMTVTEMAETRRQAAQLMRQLGLKAPKSAVLEVTLEDRSYSALRYQTGGVGHLFLGDHLSLTALRLFGPLIELFNPAPPDKQNRIRMEREALGRVPPPLALRVEAHKPFKVSFGPVEHFYHFDSAGEPAVRSYIPNRDENVRLGKLTKVSDPSIKAAQSLLRDERCDGLTLIEKGGALFFQGKETLAALAARIQGYNLIAVREVMPG